MDCIVKKPYPPIQVEKENLEYAKILLMDYVGEGGEDTAIHTYLFQGLVEPSIEEKLMQIAKVEMHHFHILGELIMKLGWIPTYFTMDSELGNYLPWTTKYVNYSISFPELLKEDIIAERKTIQRYEKHIEKIQDVYVQNILRRIIEDEEKHIECLESLYQESI